MRVCSSAVKSKVEMVWLVAWQTLVPHIGPAFIILWTQNGSSLRLHFLYSDLDFLTNETTNWIKKNCFECWFFEYLYVLMARACDTSLLGVCSCFTKASASSNRQLQSDAVTNHWLAQLLHMLNSLSILPAGTGWIDAMAWWCVEQ